MDTERTFIGAVEESTQDGSKVFVPCVYNSEFERIVWSANYCHESIEKAAYVAGIIADLLECDFKEFTKTGKKNMKLVIMLERTGTFNDEEPCDENICKDCPEYKKCKALEAEQIKKMN